jgi:hypothetical protein
MTQIDAWRSLRALTLASRNITLPAAPTANAQTVGSEGIADSFSGGNRSSGSIRLEYASHTLIGHGLQLWASSTLKGAGESSTGLGPAVLGSTEDWGLYQAVAAQGSAFGVTAVHGTQFTCCTSTKVQILTPGEPRRACKRRTERRLLRACWRRRLVYHHSGHRNILPHIAPRRVRPLLLSYRSKAMHAHTLKYALRGASWQSGTATASRAVTPAKTSCPARLAYADVC